jgi:hypothetical protein
MGGSPDNKSNKHIIEIIAEGINQTYVNSQRTASIFLLSIYPIDSLK